MTTGPACPHCGSTNTVYAGDSGDADDAYDVCCATCDLCFDVADDDEESRAITAHHPQEEPR